MLKHRVQGAALPAMLPSSPSADLSQYALLRLCFGRAVFCCPLFWRTGEHDCASPAVAPQGASRRRLLIFAQASRAGRSPASDAPQFQALIYLSMHFYGSASAERFLLPTFLENWGARLRISGGCPARGEPEALIDLCSSIACRAQPCQRCSPVLQALIYLSMHFYGSASAEPFFAAHFSGELGSTTAHLRRLPRKGRAGGAY